MSKASEWAKTLQELSFIVVDKDKRLRASVTDSGCLSITSNSYMDLTPEQALDLAAWIYTTFGEEPINV